MREAQQPSLIGAREAELILGISRSALHRLASTGRLKGIIRDQRGQGRVWLFKPEDVRALQRRGTALKRKPGRKRIRVAWCKWFGPIPDGLTVIARDGNGANLAPSNVALVPLAKRVRTAEATRPAFDGMQHNWTRDELQVLRREFPIRSTADLAHHFGVTVQAVRCQARRLKLRKDLDHVRQLARAAKALPIGTERVDRTCDTVLVKVSMNGTHNQQWRRKHHLAWEEANGRPVPTGWRVVFKDGDKRNFDSANLELASRDEISARAFANYHAYPPELRAAIKVNSALQRDIQRRMAGVVKQQTASRPGRERRAQRHWSSEMDALLRRHYATGCLETLRAELGVTLQSMRLRARRLGLRRSPEATIAFAREKAKREKSHLLTTGG